MGNGVRVPNESTVAESVPSNSDRNKLFTENAAKERPASDIIASHSRGLNHASRPGLLQSVEVQGPEAAPKMTAADPSVRRSWSASSDELQGAVTVRPVPSSLPPCKKDVSGGADTCPRSSPSDIRPTTFSPTVSGSKRRRNKNRAKKFRSFSASLVRFGPVVLRPSNENPVEVHVDATKLWVVGNTLESSSKHEIPLQKIVRVICGDESSCKIRLVLSKTEGQSNHQMDIELITTEVKEQLRGLLQEQNVRLQQKARYVRTFFYSDISNNAHMPLVTGWTELSGKTKGTSRTILMG